MRSYTQLCGISRSLDVVGGRWTLLVVRELLLGPRRFSDLRAALPGIANNLLAERLRELQEDGLVRRRRLSGPGDVQVYELTPRGQALDEVVYALIRWGAEYMEPQPDDFFRPEWLALVLRAYLPGTAEADVRARLHTGGCTIALDARDGVVQVAPLDADDEGEVVDGADVTVEADPYALLAVASGAQRMGAARREGRLRVRGPRAQSRALERLFDAVSPR